MFSAPLFLNSIPIWNVTLSVMSSGGMFFANESRRPSFPLWISVSSTGCSFGLHAERRKIKAINMNMKIFLFFFFSFYFSFISTGQQRHTAFLQRKMGLQAGRLHIHRRQSGAGALPC